MLKELLGAARWKQPPWIEPPFHCNYGVNLSVGKHFYANFSCTILDETRVEIGNNVLMGPNVKAGGAGRGLGVVGIGARSLVGGCAAAVGLCGQGAAFVSISINEHFA